MSISTKSLDISRLYYLQYPYIDVIIYNILILNIYLEIICSSFMFPVIWQHNIQDSAPQISNAICAND